MYEDPRVCGYGPRRNPWEDQKEAVDMMWYLRKAYHWMTQEEPDTNRKELCLTIEKWRCRRAEIETWLSEHPELAEAWKVEGA